MCRLNLEKLESVIGYQFQDKERLRRALTHASVQTAQGNYERLEFLGDRVLGLAVAEMLCQMFPQASEGELSVRLNALVNTEICAEIACQIGLPDFIHTGADMKEFDGRRMTNIHADVVEALIATLYMEGGLAAVRQLIARFWEERARTSSRPRRDAKTRLQEWAHQQNGAHPVYRLIKRQGPDHEPSFQIEVNVSGFAPARGSGSSKRLAEREAAQAFLAREGIEE